MVFNQGNRFSAIPTESDTAMSMKRSRNPQTNLSAGNLNYIQRGMEGGISKSARSKVQRDSNDFKAFIESEKRKSEARNKKP